MSRLADWVKRQMSRLRLRLQADVPILLAEGPEGSPANHALASRLQTMEVVAREQVAYGPLLVYPPLLPGSLILLLLLCLG